MSLLFLLVLIVLSGLPLSSCLMWVLSLLLILFCLFPVLLWRLDFFHVWLYKLPSLWLFSLDHLGLLLILLIPVLPTRICYLWTQLSAIKAHFLGKIPPLVCCIWVLISAPHIVWELYKFIIMETETNERYYTLCQYNKEGSIKNIWTWEWIKFLIGKIIPLWCLLTATNGTNS